MLRGRGCKGGLDGADGSVHVEALEAAPVLAGVGVPLSTFMIQPTGASNMELSAAGLLAPAAELETVTNETHRSRAEINSVTQRRMHGLICTRTHHVNLLLTQSHLAQEAQAVYPQSPSYQAHWAQPELDPETAAPIPVQRAESVPAGLRYR